VFPRCGKPHQNRSLEPDRCVGKCSTVRPAVSEVGDFTGFLKLFIEKIDSGSLDFTAQMNATLRGYETFVGQQLTALVRMMLLSDLITQVQADKDD